MASSSFANLPSSSAATYSLVHASPEQMRRRKIVKKGFSLCLMVCGHGGTGKSTFINTLCNGSVFPEHRIKSTTEMELHDKTVQLDEEDGTSIHLTVVDTPGFGDAIDNNHCCDKIVKYLEDQYDDILVQEQRVKRNPRFIDNRVHAALYFIAPTGHGLRELDIDLMMALSARVNVIPVIAKADTLTREELIRNKRAIMNDIEYFKIPIYYFPCETEDEETIREGKMLRELVPFSIVGSNEYHKINVGDNELRWAKARKYPWGTVAVEDPSQSDFATLRSVLFGSHLQELRDLTHEYLYEKYRTEKLSENDPATLESPEKDSYTYTPTTSTTIPSTMPGVTQTLHKEQQHLQQIEEQYQREIAEKRAEIIRREQELKEIAAKLASSNNNTYKGMGTGTNTNTVKSAGAESDTSSVED